MKQPPTDTGVCGEYRGVRRHQRRGQQLCPPCQNAFTTYNRARKDKAREALGKPTRAEESHANTRTIIEEIEFFLQCGEGEHAILRALRTTQPTLKRRLQRAKRTDLMPRIFQPTPNDYVRRAA